MSLTSDFGFYFFLKIKVGKANGLLGEENPCFLALLKVTKNTHPCRMFPDNKREMSVYNKLL